MKIIWYVPPHATVRGPFTVASKYRASGVVEIKCSYAGPNGFMHSGYNIARVEDVPLGIYDMVAENVRLLAEMGLYEPGL